MRVAALLLVTASLVNGQDCTAAITSLTYPRLARITEIAGNVTVSLGVNELGRAENMQFHGHSILSRELERAITAATFPGHCRQQELQFTVDFLLAGELADEAHTTIKHTAPGHIAVTSNATGIICAMTTSIARPRSPFRRVLHALFQ